MKIAANSIKTGNILSHKDSIWRVVKNQAVQPGKSGAYAQVEMRNLINGSKLKERFRATEYIEKVRLDQKTHTFLYSDGDMLVLMDSETFEQIEIDRELAGDQAAFIVDGMTVEVEFFEEKPISIALPATIEATVSETEPNIKGRAVSSSFKPAVLDNGVTVKVPEYIAVGDKISVDSSTREFVKRL